MGLRTQLALFFVAFLVVGFCSILLSITYMLDQLSIILTTRGFQETEQALRILLFGQAAGLIFAILVLLLFLYLLLGRFIVRPLRGIAKAMTTLADTGKRLPLPSTAGAPREIRLLADTFTDFADKVEIAHKQDMEISRVKSDFISTAAHQLRTPLTGIRWALEALQMGNITEEQKALVKSATDKSHELVNIVGTLLDISSIESGKYKYSFAPCDMQALVEEVVQDFSAFAQKSQVSMYFANTGSSLPAVRIDRERMKWVLNNLVENAIRYTPAGGSVRLTTEAFSGRVYVRVKDTGIGINKQDRSNIFERFYRAQNAVAKENAGNGLGLYIARSIATDHGGDLNFEDNKDGPGTTFTLSIPIATQATL